MAASVDNQAGFSVDQVTAVQAGLARMNCPADTEVLVTKDFVNDVRQIIDSHDYGIDRGTGVVAAKTIPLDSGHCVIVVNAEVAADLDHTALTRLLAHESGHALLDERGEDSPDTRSTWMGDRVLRSLAATAIEEYRAERAVYAHGFGLAAEVDWPAGGDLATEMNLAVMHAVLIEEKNKTSPVELASDITAVHNWSSKKLAYIAAAVDSGALPAAEALPEENQDDWNDYVKDTWAYRLAGYRTIPDAATPATAGDLDRAIAKLMTVERRFLKSMGFYYKEVRNSWGFYRIKDDRLFDRRWERAVRVAAARHADD